MHISLRTSFRRILAGALLVISLGSSDALAQRAEGIDVSRWQGTINWTSVRGAGKSFAWAQATRGAYLTNVNFVANMINGKAAGVLMGAYHYATPATNSPTTEANYFWNLAGPYILADGKSLMPMLDIEEFTGHVGATSYSDWANQWYNIIVSKAANAGVDITPVMYSSACHYCNLNSTCSQFGSWVANYMGGSPNPQSGTPWVNCSGCNLWGNGLWHFWQYSSTGSVPGISGNVDLDVFNGTEAQLSTWVATAAGADTTPPTISGVSSSGVSDSSATITWTTDENSDSVVEYGTTTSYGSTANNTSMVLNHSVTLTGLSASTLYHYRVKSKDAANNTATSGDFTFTTLAPGAVADIVIDNPAATVVGTWSTGTSATDKFGTNYRYKSQGTGSSYLQYTPSISTAGDYQVYEWHTQGSNRDSATPHVIRYNGGTVTLNVNQQINGGRWNLLGTFNLASGTAGYVRITDAISTSGQIAMADAIKFVYAAVPPPPPTRVVHVQSITMSWVKSGKKYKANAVVNVRDASGAVVSGATVTGNFTGAINESNKTATTDASGNASITSTAAITTGTVTFTVSNISGTGLTYDSAANVVTSATQSR